jgi:hypothetical protein
MNKKFSRMISISMLLALLISSIPLEFVYAADLLDITPDTVNNTVDTVITVSGTGFDNSAVILLDGGALGTSFLNDQTLTATVPAGLSAGPHAITVSMSGGLANNTATLTVNAPPPTSTPVPPTSTPTLAPFNRPQFVVVSSKVNGGLQTGGNVTLKVVIENVGQATAYSTQAVYTSADLVPTKTGGVVALGNVPYDDQKDVSQTFYVSAQIYGRGIIVTDLTVNYYDEKGSSYADKFTLSMPVNGTAVSGGSAAATATPTGVKSSQLVITEYSSSVDPLQPGEQFSLKMTVQNMGNVKAQRITMIVGGGSSGTSGGTPQPGGVSGGSGDFANFAPVGSSNVQSLGDLGAGDTTHMSQNLIVNVSTNPGAYPVKISFSYLNDKSEVINDEQVITLLVYSLPSVDVSFYRPIDSFFVGQPGALPIQVVNLGRRLSVLGNIKVSAESGLVESGSGLVGSLDAGGYFTLDSMFTPDQPGPQSLDVKIEYVDDFNQPRVITKKLEIEVLDSFVEPTPDPTVVTTDGMEPYTAEETTLHKFFRFVKGLFGLDSAWPVWQAPGGGGGGGGGGSEETVPISPGGKG